MRPKSTSYAEYTCGDVWMLITMCSAIFLRITPIFSMRTFSPGWNAGGGAIGARATAGAAALAARLRAALDEREDVLLRHAAGNAGAVQLA